MVDQAVFVVGSINHDLMVSTPIYPQLGETVHGHHMTGSPGGKGSNQAVAAATLGARTFMVGRVGADNDGRAMVKALSRARVDTTAIVATQDSQTGLAVVTHTDAGKNAIIVIGGANDALRESDVERSLSGISAGDVVVTQLEIPKLVVLRALQLGCEQGAMTILNAAPAARVDELLPFVGVLVVNEFEAGAVAGMDVPGVREARLAAASIAKRHQLTVILTLGDKGAMVIDEGEVIDIAPFPITPVDSTGAGDTFVGALAAFLALGHDLKHSCLWASAAGAHACLHLGAQAGAPTQQQLADRFGVGPGRKHD